MIHTNVIKPYISGLHLGSYTYLFSNILDYTLNKEDTMSILKQNPQLYVASTIANFKNLIGLSPLYYIFADNLILHDKSVHFQLFKLLGMLLTHNITFYLIHKCFHDYKSLYHIHKFHHKFVKPVPSNGNAVSMTEYNIAYVLPFIIGAILTKPNELTFKLAIGIISFLNSLVHSGKLKHLRYPSLFVTPSDHLTHHEKLDTKYASPILNIDNIVNRVNKMFNNEHSKYKYARGI